MVRLVVLVALLAVLTVACGGDDNGGESASTVAPAGPEATVRGTGANGPSGATPPVGSTGSGGGSASSTLNSLPSYRYEVTMEGSGSIADSFDLEAITGSDGSGSFKYTITGSWIAPDKAQLELDFAGQSVKQTVIGNQQWIAVAGVAQGPVPADGKAEDLTLATVIVDQQFVDAVLTNFDCATTEEVNGVRSKRCDGDLDALNRNRDQFSGIFGDTSIGEATAYDASIWTAEQGGYPVKADIRMAGKTTDGKDFTLALSFDVTDIGKVTELTP